MKAIRSYRSGSRIYTAIIQPAGDGWVRAQVWCSHLSPTGHVERTVCCRTAGVDRGDFFASLKAQEALSMHTAGMMVEEVETPELGRCLDGHGVNGEEAA